MAIFKFLNFQILKLNYYSLNKQSPIASFKEATILGQAPDKGLYFPESIPQVDKDLISNIDNISNEEIAFRVIKPYVGNEIAEDDLYRIVSETVNFPIPLVQVSENISSLELFHGPTLAFKDVGARFMSRQEEAARLPQCRAFNQPAGPLVKPAAPTASANLKASF